MRATPPVIYIAYYFLLYVYTRKVNKKALIFLNLTMGPKLTLWQYAARLFKIFGCIVKLQKLTENDRDHVEDRVIERPAFFLLYGFLWT